MAEVPEQFLNQLFVETKQENLDDFLAVRGVPWLIRKLISGKLKNGRFHLTKSSGDSFHILTGDPAKNLEYTFELGKKFKATGYDGKEHEITYTVEGGRFKEVHLNLARPETGEDVFWYEVRNGVLYSECTASKDGKTATWKREFTKK